MILALSMVIVLFWFYYIVLDSGNLLFENFNDKDGI